MKDKNPARLSQHPVFSALTSKEDLQCFMEHHVFAVWDFMSLIKSLQATIAPTAAPWRPTGNSALRRFINELVLEEESDQSNVTGEFTSHFELYLRAMREVGANTAVIEEAVERAVTSGIEAALSAPEVPEASRHFTAMTFSFIDPERPHRTAAALAVGREQPIPGMFRAALASLGVSASEAPSFHYYLNRHVHLDEDFHGPLSKLMVETLCADDPVKISEADTVADQAIAARLRFLDEVLEAISSARARRGA